MTIYFTRLISVSLDTEDSVVLSIPTMNRVLPGSNAWTFEHESDNEQEVAHWFRGIMLASSTGGARWLTPVSLEKDQRWMEGENLTLFEEARGHHGL